MFMRLQISHFLRSGRMQIRMTNINHIRRNYATVKISKQINGTTRVSKELKVRSNHEDPFKKWLFLRQPPNNFMHMLSVISQVIAVGAFVWSLKSHQDAMERDMLKQQERRLFHDMNNAELSVSAKQPRKTLSKLKKALKTGMREQEQGITGTAEILANFLGKKISIDSVAAQWVKALEQDKAWALQVDNYRGSLKLMWYEVMKAHEAIRECDGMPEMSKFENMMNDFLHDGYPLGIYLAQAMINIVEPLDKAAYSAMVEQEPDEEYDWESRRPLIYKFIENEYGIHSVPKKENVKRILKHHSIHTSIGIPGEPDTESI